MCRIAAIITQPHLVDESKILSMTQAMHRGGPDDSGHIINQDLGYALGHRRLSIIDLSAGGHQPMVDDTYNIEIIFNGEIYNYVELKEQLETVGYKFFSKSDTEVLIKGYKYWGKDLLPRLRGMFAFIIIDKNNKTLFAARDHAGIKPLYIGRRNNSLYFSSEIRGIKAAEPNWEENPDWKIWFLTYGFLPEPNTTLSNVKPLPRGHHITINLVTKQEYIEQFTSYSYNKKVVPFAEAVATTKQLVHKAVERHLVADVPVGVFLSGGIDSSLLTILAQQQQKSPIETISIYFDDEKYSEKEFQEIIIKQTGVKHHLYKITKEEFCNSWQEIYNSIDQPSTDAINTHFICKYAKEIGLKVVLSGLGADEIFGGYPSIKRVDKFNQFARVAVLNKVLPAMFLESYPKRKIQFLNNKIESAEYLVYRGLFTPKDVAEILEITEDEVWQVLKQLNFQEDINKLLPQDRATYYETALYMQSQLLRDSDTQSMWHSLELRVPFLDKDLMEYVNSLHPDVKFSSPKTKGLLVDAFLNELPERIWNRPKQGFTFPFENWFKNMKVFNNPKIIPTTYNNKFKNGKLNFARLWAVFLVANAQVLNDIATLD